MPNHYNFEKEEGQEFIYCFSTDKGIHYRIAFTEDHNLTLLSNENFDNLYTLSILREECIKPGHDPRIKATVYEIVKTFFAFRDKCVIYICSEDGNKAAGRHKTFNKWHEECDFKDDLVKYDNVIVEGERHVYTSLIYHQECPNIDRILEVFKEIENLYKDMQASA